MPSDASFGERVWEQFEAVVQEPPLADLPLPFPLDSKVRQALTAYAEQLVDANRQFNLTAITDVEGVAIKHLADSLTALLAGRWPQGASVCDVGTGAGLPGLILGTVRPDLTVTMMDASKKKLAFVENCRVMMGVEGRTVHGRAEDFGRDPEHRGAYDVVVARAVARLPVLLELCLPFCAPQGWLVAMKGPDASVEVHDSQEALAVLGGRVEDIRDLELPRGAGRRTIIAIQKVGPTPAEFPRRAGIPAKKPIGL